MFAKDESTARGRPETSPIGFPASRRDSSYTIRTLCLIGACLGASTCAAMAQSPLPSYPLYCRGPLTTPPHTVPLQPAQPTLTVFKWANVGAGAQAPSPGECAWADRGVRPEEIVERVNPHGNAICDNSGLVAGVAAGKYLEVGVYRDPDMNNCMHLTHYIGSVNPPFSPQPVLPPFVRQSIAKLTAAQITSLQKGLRVMMGRPKDDPTSFWFQANIHGTYDTPMTPTEMQGWNQCEHSSYYFFAWHRMYAYFFERLLRAASGDANLALPYWDWSDPSQRTLPVAFRLPANPATNPLYVSARNPAMNNGSGQLPAPDVDYKPAFKYTNFDSPNGSPFSFGGQIAPPTHFASVHGQLEQRPHDQVHGDIGGLMADPNTSAQDPIFYLHHDNIDRLWKRWLDEGLGRQDPLNDAAWMNTKFTFYDENRTAVTLSGQQIVDTIGSMNYRYDDDNPPAPPQPGGRSVPHPAMLAMQNPRPLATSQPAATGPRITLADTSVTVPIPLSEEAAKELEQIVAPNVKTRIILQLDDLQYEGTPEHNYQVYLDLPQGQTPDWQSPYFVGTLSFFGLKPHTMPGNATGTGQNISLYYDVTDVVRELSGRRAFNEKQVTVTMVPSGLVDHEQKPLPVAPGVMGTIGRITLAVQ